MGFESRRRQQQKLLRTVTAEFLHEIAPGALNLARISLDSAAAASALALHFGELAQRGEAPSPSELAHAADIRAQIEQAQMQLTELFTHMAPRRE